MAVDGATVAGPRIPRVVRRFLDTEAASGILLVIAAAVALLWANSPWQHGYHELWSTEIHIAVGKIERAFDLEELVNDGLMTFFFLVVGLEIKRELVAGELRDPRTAALPAIAALGGMVVPVLLYLAITAGSPGVRGWGVPMATDIAFAVGVLALLSRRVPSSLKLFLLTLAIVDDIGAIIVIAVAYSKGIEPLALGVAVASVGLVVAMRAGNVRWHGYYIAAGVVLWAAVYEAGVHATLAGVVMGLLAPARPVAPASVVREWTGDLADEPTPYEIATMTALARQSVSVAERLEYQLHPMTSFLIVPLFALANAGVTIEGDGLEAAGAGRVLAGVVVGLVVGKLVGISLFAWLALRFRVGVLPPDLRPGHVVGGAAVAGIGFTVSLFVAALAFDDPELVSAAKIGVLVASLLASAIGALVLIAYDRPSRSVPPSAEI
jgi:Na+:H+ antiporter, NhaA family